MAKNSQQLNRYEEVLYKQLTEIMSTEKKKFPEFLPALVDNVPTDNTEYLKTLKKEHMKYRRSSLSMEEVFKMLKIANWRLAFSLDDKPVDLSNYVVDIDGKFHRIRFTDFMIMCEMFNITIEWLKDTDRASDSNH